jgi:hypothetical protein
MSLGVYVAPRSGLKISSTKLPSGPCGLSGRQSLKASKADHHVNEGSFATILALYACAGTITIGVSVWYLICGVTTTAAGLYLSEVNFNGGSKTTI